jgi:hypothetical protein
MSLPRTRATDYRVTQQEQEIAALRTNLAELEQTHEGVVRGYLDRITTLKRNLDTAEAKFAEAQADIARMIQASASNLERAERAEARLAQVLALHAPGYVAGRGKVCMHCVDLSAQRVSWPCPTVRLLKGEDVMNAIVALLRHEVHK